MTREELVLECKQKLKNGVDSDAILKFLRISGCSKIESIAIVVAVYAISLAEAKELVHFSSTWKDTRRADDEFHEALVDAVNRKSRD